MGTINVRAGKLQMDFRYNGERYREQTKLPDTPANRKRVKQILDRIEAEITLGTFKYWSISPKAKREKCLRPIRILRSSIMQKQVKQHQLLQSSLSYGFQRRLSNGALHTQKLSEPL